MTDWRSYDGVAETYERVHAPQTMVPARDLVALAAPPEGASVLDVGAGTGVAAGAASEAIGPGGLVVGVDPSLGMLRVAARTRPQPSFVAAEVIQLPFRDATFDLILATFSLSHFTRLDTALFDMVRVLRPGGRLAASAWTVEPDELEQTWTALVEQVTGREMLRGALQDALPWKEHLADPRRLEETLRDAGLRPVRVERSRYRFSLSLEDYVTEWEIHPTGRFIREMLGPKGWESFRERARKAFSEKYPDPALDFREALLAVGTKPPG